MRPGNGAVSAAGSLSAATPGLVGLGDGAAALIDEQSDAEAVPPNRPALDALTDKFRRLRRPPTADFKPVAPSRQRAYPNHVASAGYWSCPA